MAFRDRNLGDETKYLLEFQGFNDFDDHSGCPIGRHDASRPPPSGTGTYSDQVSETQTVMNLAIRLSRTVHSATCAKRGKIR